MTETVLYATNESCSDVYHLIDEGKPKCRMVRRKGREWREKPRETAEQSRRVCKTCRDGRPSKGDGAAVQSKPLEAKCPFCGATVSHLPVHLPCDGAAGAAEVSSDG